MKLALLFFVVLTVAFVFLRVFTKRDRKGVRRGVSQLLVPTLIAVAAVFAAVVIGLSPSIKVI